MTKAQMYGNRQLMEALSEQRVKLLELYALKERNLAKDIESRQQQERTAKSQTDTSGELASNLERVASAANALNGVSLAGLHSQIEGLHGAVNRLGAAL